MQVDMVSSYASCYPHCTRNSVLYVVAEHFCL